MRNIRLLSWAQGFYVAGLALGLLFIIPSAWFPIQLGKIAICAVFMLIAGVLFILSSGSMHLVRRRNLVAVLLVALLPVVYLLSWAFSIDPAIALKGFAAEGDTVIFVTLLFAAFTLGVGLFRNVASSRMLVAVVAGAAALATLFQVLVITTGSTMLPSVFNDRSVNLVGKWNDLGLLIGLLFLLLVIMYEFGVLSAVRKGAALVAMVVCAFMLAIVNFSLIWILLLVFSLVVALGSFVMRRGADAGGSLRRVIPWVPLGVALVSFVLVVWGTIVNTGLTNVFPVSSLEVRPSYSSTVDIEKLAHGSSFTRFLLGTGPRPLARTG
jgi:hypothetical protein